jgi:hypothetical protein
MRVNMLRYIFAVLALGGSLLSNSQELRVTASIDSVVLPIGQQTKVRLDVVQPKEVILNFPLFGNELFDKIEILEQSDVDSATIDETTLRLSKTYTVTSFDSGFYAIPPFVLTIDSQSGGGQILSNPLALKVLTFDVDTTQGIFDVKPIQSVPYTLAEIVPWVVGGVLFVGLIIFFIWLFRRLRRNEPVFSIVREKVIEPPHIIALRELDQIKKEKLWQTGRVKEFYTQLTDVLRTYIEGRYNVQALEMTSGETLQELKSVMGDEQGALQNLKQVLLTADMVKFAKASPLPDENDLSMMNAYFFVNQTKIVEVKPLDELASETQQTNKEA